MKTLCTLFALLLLAPLCSHASSLEKEMKSIGRAMKALGQQIDNASQKQSSLKLVADLKAAALKSKELTPSKTKEIPAAEQGKFLSDYREAMGKLVIEYEKIEAALKSDKFDQARSLFSDLKDIKHDGHERFASEE